MKKQTAIFFYVLGVYVVLQFAWWGYHLIELTDELSSSEAELSHRIIMIIGEGLVFFLIVMLGLWKIRSSIKKELKVSHNQTNFLLSVTHELKTPIATTKLYLQTLKKRTLSEEKQAEMLDKALSENERLEKLINNILNASRLESQMLLPQKEMINLSVTLDNICRLFEKHQSDVKLTTIIPSNIEASADEFFLQTIIGNFIDNALKYGGNEITVTLTESPLSIIVSDNGPGVPVGIEKEIFTKFYRSGDEETRTQKGSGLGLFIAAQFSRLHGSQIKYTPNVPKGARFELIL